LGARKLSNGERARHGYWNKISAQEGGGSFWSFKKFNAEKNHPAKWSPGLAFELIGKIHSRTYLNIASISAQ
jgi:hypothetical protein